MILELWRTRDKPRLLSREWTRAWLKRVLKSPDLLKQFYFHARLKIQGAKICHSDFFSDPSLIIGKLHLFKVGKESFIGRVEIAVHESVIIGDHVCINDGVRILTASHDLYSSNWSTIANPITIKDYAWIATGAIILPGVTIGRGAVVGAGSVVTRDIPDYGVAVGCPARLNKRHRCLDLSYSPTASLALFTAWRRV